MKEQTTKVKRRKYDATFKQEVLQMIVNGRSVKSVAESLGIGENLIYRWESRAKQSSASVNVAFTEQEALLGCIRELEVERDILKKALAIFSRPT